MPSAPTTSSAVRSARIDQPTQAREQPSSSAARYSTPSSVGSSLKSPIHSASGRSAVKLRPTRSGAAVALGSRRVVWCRRRIRSPAMPARHIRRATRLRLTRMPWARRSSAWMRGAP